MSMPDVRPARSKIPQAEENPLAISLPDLRNRLSLLESLEHELNFSTELYSRVLDSGAAASPRSAGSEMGPGQMSVVTAVLTLMKAMVGPMLLFTPHMFAEAGALLAALTFILVSVLSSVGMLRLVDVHESIVREGNSEDVFSDDDDGHGGGAFAQIGQRAAGRAGFVMVEACLVVSQWLYCVGYPIFVARNLESVLLALLPAEAAPSLVTLTVAQLPILVPYCWVRDLHYLGYPMLVANVCLWGSLLVVLSLVGAQLMGADSTTGAGLGHSVGHEGGRGQIEWVRFGTGSLLFSAQAVVAFEGIALVLPIRASMREPARFTPVLIGCMAAGTLTYVTTGYLGYAAFGDATSTFVTMNLDGPLSICARVAFALSVVLTYPLQLFPALQALEDRLGLSSFPPQPGTQAALRRLAWQCLARSFLVGAAFAFSLTAPYDNLVGLAGGLCAVPLAFIFPGWFHLVLCEKQSTVSKAVDVVMIAFGAVMAPVAVVAALVSWT